MTTTELDIAVAEAIGLQVYHGDELQWGCFCYADDFFKDGASYRVDGQPLWEFCPSGDLNDAFKAAEAVGLWSHDFRDSSVYYVATLLYRLPETGKWAIAVHCDWGRYEGYSVDVETPECDTPAEAICRAILKMKEMQANG